MKDKVFGVLQRVGRSFMLPIALLPVAGLLLGIGGSFTNETMLNAYGLMGFMGPGTLLYAVFTVMKQDVYKRQFDTCVTVGKDSSCAIHSDTFRQLDVVIQREIIRRAIGVAAGKLKDVEREHVEMIRGLLDKPVGRRCHLPCLLYTSRCV